MPSEHSLQLMDVMKALWGRLVSSVALSTKLELSEGITEWTGRDTRLATHRDCNRHMEQRFVVWLCLLDYCPSFFLSTHQHTDRITNKQSQHRESVYGFITCRRCVLRKQTLVCEAPDTKGLNPSPWLCLHEADAG